MVAIAPCVEIKFTGVPQLKRENYRMNAVNIDLFQMVAIASCVAIKFSGVSQMTAAIAT